jgi:2-iminoacetate synthase ThiH
MRTIKPSSFGMIFSEDVIRLFYLVKNIQMGYTIIQSIIVWNLSMKDKILEIAKQKAGL